LAGGPFQIKNRTTVEQGLVPRGSIEAPSVVRAMVSVVPAVPSLLDDLKRAMRWRMLAALPVDPTVKSQDVV
jgi:hypothetical protein